MDINNELAIYAKYNLSSSNWLLLRLLILAIEEDKKEYLFQYLSNNESARLSLRDDLVNLQNLGIITKSYTIPEKGEKFNYNNITFNKVFLKDYFRCSGDLGQDLFEKYPPFLETNTTMYPLRNISKKFDSLEEFFYVYGKNINFSYKKHEEIIDLLKWASENNLLTWTIVEFVISNKWLELEILRSSGNSGIFKTVENI